MDDYRVVWKQIGPGSPLAEELGIPEGAWLPFLLGQGRAREMEQDEKISVSTFDLLGGILVGYHEVSAEFDTGRSRELFPYAVDHIRDVFQAPDLDELLLDAIRRINDLYGADAARHALDGARALRPESDRIATIADEFPAG